jgi:Uncharacterized protein conserved in bacteria (DUF2213)
MSALRIQYSPIKIHQDSDGVMTIEAIARHSGVLKYRSDSGDRLELVPDDLILAKDSDDLPVMGWLAGASATNEHPTQLVRYDEKAKKAFEVGKVQDDVHIYKDSSGVRKVRVRIDVADPVTQEQIRKGEKRGVSMGYMCGVKEDSGEWHGQKYTHIQEMPLRIDHLAIVANPRAPEALITRFDSEDAGDVAWSVAEETAAPSIEIIHVDACCAACEAPKSAKKVDEPEPGIKKTPKPKKDSDEQMTTATLERSDAPSASTQIMFRSGAVNVPDELLTSLHADGVLELVELNGLEFLVGGDFATDLRNDGLIDHEDANCQGNGWVPGGPNGKGKRAPKGANTKAGAVKAAAGGASLKKFGKANLNEGNTARLATLRKKRGTDLKAMSMGGGTTSSSAIAAARFGEGKTPAQKKFLAKVGSARLKKEKASGDFGKKMEAMTPAPSKRSTAAKKGVATKMAKRAGKPGSAATESAFAKSEAALSKGRTKKPKAAASKK